MPDPTDTERLDWLERNRADVMAVSVTGCWEVQSLDHDVGSEAETLRAAIDDAMREDTE